MTTGNQGTPVPAEQVAAMLRTRGFETGGFGSPLRYFRGRMLPFTGAMVQRGNMKTPKLEVTYHFAELEVYDSVEPYPFPEANISIMHSTSDGSQASVLGKSIDRIINAGTDENLLQEQVNNQDFLVGKLQEWRYTPGHKTRKPNEQNVWEETTMEAWEVTWVEGVGGTPYSGGGVAAPAVGAPGVAPQAPAQPAGLPPEVQAVNLLEGKTLQQFNSVVFQDPVVKTDQALMGKIIGQTWIAELEAAGTVFKDDNGVYHKAAA